MNRRKSNPVILEPEQEDLLKLIDKLSGRFSFELRIHYQSKKILDAKRKKRAEKLLKPRKKRNSEKEQIKLKHLPSMLAQAISLGIPLHSPKRKDRSKPELEQTIYESLDKEETQKINYNYHLSIDEIDYKPNKIYLQRLDADNSKMIVKLFVDWGFVRSNKLDLFLDNEGKEISDNYIVVINSSLKHHGTFSLSHMSKYIEDNEESAKALFIGQMTGLKPNSEYYYRLECYNKLTKKLFAATDFIKFKTSFNLNEVNKSLFLTVSSDLHGGRKGQFLRGKLGGKEIKGNIALGRVFRRIAKTELDATFGEGYSLSIATGDLTENASYSEYWADLFKRCSVLWNHVPLITCIGNHDYYTSGQGRGNVLGGREEDCRYWHRFITNPNNSPGSLIGHWYSLDQGNVHAVFLDTNGTGWGKYKIKCDSEQWHWLENDLREWREKLDRGEKVPQFCFVFMHSAIMSLGFWGRGFNNGNDERVQTYLTTLFRKYGVDIVCSGHDHIYQRSIWSNTVYLQNGRHGGMTRPYLKLVKHTVKYDLERIVENNRTRIYPVLYVPPNNRCLSKGEKDQFEEFKQKIRAELLTQPIAYNYYFGLRRINQQLGKLFDKNIKLKEQLIDKFIIPKLDDHVWMRSYAVEDYMKPNLREIIDMAFIPSNSNLKTKDYDIICPEKIVR
ncbi:MAG: hypothetical protein FK734_04290 [Asgard group archaeon]|nr:hypothetical protein [Asgard group archaeon]